MLRTAVVTTAFMAAQAVTTATGQAPSYHDPATRALVEEMVAAHGGMERWGEVPAFSFQILSRVRGQREPWLSTETIEPATGRAYHDWPLLKAQIGWDGNDLWTVNWHTPVSPGFLTRLSYSFIALPFLTQTSGAKLRQIESGTLPDDDTEYRRVRMTLAHRSPTVPGEFYELYIHPETRLLAAIGFNITHPAMVAITGQAIGPIIHVMEEYVDVDGLILPNYYVSFGYNPRTGLTSSAIHVVFDISVDQPFDENRMQRPAGATTDNVSLEWWSGS